MSYRVETAASGRATCKSTECKKNGTKIGKDELRMGTWVPYEEQGSWHWRHWGCVTGRQLQNLRNYLEDPAKPGVYRWDFLDGYDGDEKNNLTKHPDLQEKVRRVITQGYIDPEDFNGDPEMNKLGESGLHTPATKKAKREEARKRAREEAGEDIEDAENASPSKKARGKKAAKKEESDEEEVIPAKKARGKKGIKKEESDEEEVIPAKKVRGKKAKKEEIEPKEKGKVKDEPVDEPNGIVSAEVAQAKTTKKGRGKKNIKKEDAGANGAEDAAEPEPTEEAPKKKGRPKKAVKDEPIEESGIDDAVEPAKKVAKKGRGRKAAAEVVEEPADEAAKVEDPDPSEKEAEVAKKKGGKGKKAAAAAAAVPKNRRAHSRGQTEF